MNSVKDKGSFQDQLKAAMELMNGLAESAEEQQKNSYDYSEDILNMKSDIKELSEQFLRLKKSPSLLASTKGYPDLADRVKRLEDLLNVVSFAMSRALVSDDDIARADAEFAEKQAKTEQAKTELQDDSDAVASEVAVPEEQPIKYAKIKKSGNELFFDPNTGMLAKPTDKGAVLGKNLIMPLNIESDLRLNLRLSSLEIDFFKSKIAKIGNWGKWWDKYGRCLGQKAFLNVLMAVRHAGVRRLSETGHGCTIQSLARSLNAPVSSTYGYIARLRTMGVLDGNKMHYSPEEDGGPAHVTGEFWISKDYPYPSGNGK